MAIDRRQSQTWDFMPEAIECQRMLQSYVNPKAFPGIRYATEVPFGTPIIIKAGYVGIAHYGIIHGRTKKTLKTSDVAYWSVEDFWGGDFEARTDEPPDDVLKLLKLLPG